MSRYQQLAVFASVAELGSLSAAARELELAPATVLRTVAALEARLNATLLVRSPRGVSLSPVGEQFAARCQQILQQTAEAERSAAGLHSHVAGQLTVAMPLLMAHQVFMPLAVEYLDAFPAVQLLTETRESLPKLLEEGLDAALVVGHLADSSGFAVEVGNVRPIMCAAPAYLAQWGHPESPEDLRQHRTILATASGHSPEWRLHSGTTTRTIRTTPVLTCSTQQAAIQAAVAGLGLIRCLNHEAHQQLQNGQLRAILQPFSAPALPVHLLYREGRKACGRLRTFIDFAVPRLRNHPALRGE
jgi:DNA-binding transcriptional LysR family regulator